MPVVGRTAEIRDGKGKPQGKGWKIAGTAEQETCCWDRTNCTWVRCMQNKKWSRQKYPGNINSIFSLGKVQVRANSLP